MFRHTDMDGTNSFDGALVVVDYNGTFFGEVQVIHLGNLAGLDPAVMILNGGLYLFGTEGGSPINPAPLHASVHEGSLGGCNSIIVNGQNQFPAGGSDPPSSDYIYSFSCSTVGCDQPGNCPPVLIQSGDGSMMTAAWYCPSADRKLNDLVVTLCGLECSGAIAVFPSLSGRPFDSPVSTVCLDLAGSALVYSG